MASPLQFPPGAPWDAALTTLVGLGIGACSVAAQQAGELIASCRPVFLGGVGYLAWYKRHVLNKVRPLPQIVLRV